MSLPLILSECSSSHPSQSVCLSCGALPPLACCVACTLSVVNTRRVARVAAMMQTGNECADCSNSRERGNTAELR